MRNCDCGQSITESLRRLDSGQVGCSVCTETATLSQSGVCHGWLPEICYCESHAPAEMLIRLQRSDATVASLAARYNMTPGEYRAQQSAYLQCEGYDDTGREHLTLASWLHRRPGKTSYEPYDGGRGAGMLGVEV